MNKRILEVLIVVSSLILALLFSYSPAGKVIDLKVYDIFSRIKPKPKEWDKILYVDINDESIENEGHYPWPRTEVAKGIQVMKEFGADRILLDIEFIDSSVDSLNYDYYYNFIAYSNQNLPYSYVKDHLIIQPDKELARAMYFDSNANVYLACHGTDESKKSRTDVAKDTNKEFMFILDPFFIPLSDKSLVKKLPSDKYLEIPVFPLYMFAKGLGFSLAEKDPNDGVMRKVHLFRIYNNYIVPQLALPLLMDEWGVDKKKIEIKPGREIKMVTRTGKTVSIPINQSGEMYINWSKRWSQNPFSYKGIHIPYYSLIEYYNYRDQLKQQMDFLKLPDLTADDRATLIQNISQLKDNIAVLSNKLSILKGKITITGLTATATSDFGPTTIESSSPMVLTHGNVINTIYSGQFLSDLPDFLNILNAVLIILLFFFLSIKIESALQEIAVSAVVLVVVMIFGYILLAAFGIILNYILLLSVSGIGLVSFTAYKFVSYDRQKNYIKKAFMQYLSPEVVQQVIANPGLLKLGGERREITAYFSDVAGFTTISEKLSPEEVVSLLNKYLTAMTDIILENGGTVDKYEGDAIVAFFGAPIPYANHAERCCNAAVDMQNALNSLRQKWIEEGYPPVNVRMGMNTGPAIIGNMGSQQRMDYTMMGDTVNSASRFEGANKAYGTYTMISETTYEYVKDKFVTRKLDLLRVVGKSVPITVYELVGRVGEVKDQKLEIIDKYHRALDHYSSQNWEKAAGMFKELVRTYNDAPSQAYYERCIKFKKSPPPAGWDGVFILKSK